MKKYLTISKNNFLSFMAYRFYSFMTLVGNLTYLVLVYFLWRSIYSKPGQVINGMDFNQAMLYMTLATVMSYFLLNYVDWRINDDIVSGNIIMSLIKPLDYQLQGLSNSVGSLAVNGLFVGLPSSLLVIFILKPGIQAGWNIAFFAAAVVLAFLVNFLVNFTTGLLAFYTQSIWGFFYAKDIIVMFLSGATIPLNFFPGVLRGIVELLPFRAIYSIPLQMLTSGSITITKCLYLLSIQLFWVAALFILSRWLFSRAIKVVTVSGG